MKWWWVPLFIWLSVFPAFCVQQPKVLQFYAPYVAKPNQTIQVQVYLDPGSQVPVTVKMEPEPYLQYSDTEFFLKGEQHKFLTVKITSQPQSGLAWFLGTADNGYGDGWAVTDISFDGHLKVTSTEAITSDRPTTLSLAIVDRDGKPIPFDGDLELKLNSVDAKVNGRSGEEVPIAIPSAARYSPLFTVRPNSPWGGNVHFTGVLTAPNYTHILAQEQFVFAARPAFWVPILLAFLGGMLHALYKVVKLPLPMQRRVWLYASLAIIATSSISSLIGYLFADYDPLGFKIDPSVLHTYVIVGFLFSYFGVEGFLADKLQQLPKPQASLLPAQGTDPKASS